MISFIGLVCIVVLVSLFCVGRYSLFKSKTLSKGVDGFSMESKWQFADLVQGSVLYPVSHVFDGDTINIRVPDTTSSTTHDVTIRVIGIDTPETVDPRKPVQCYGPEASVEAKELFASTSVYVEKDPAKGDYDKYGRVLAYIQLADGRSYNEYMLKNGFAREYTSMNQPYKYQLQFKVDALVAKKAKLGLWDKCNSNK